MHKAHYVIGTAGHIDHGKTSLVKGLTGIDTDRFEEEKRRGITIDLGFAYLDLPSGQRVGIVDVPGHERFIRNMLAGAGGMDAVLLVIAADEGIKPQTQEHLDILSYLDLQKGIVVFTKADLVEDEWLELLQEEVKEQLKGTFLEEAPMVAVSSVTGRGMEALVKQLEQVLEQTPPKKVREPMRLPIDRVFTLQGIGTIVTGTLMEGVVREGDVVEVFPKHIEVKVRHIQVHGTEVKEAEAGQRVALNVTGIKKEDLQRGDVLAAVDSMTTASFIDASLQISGHSHRSLGHWSRIRVYQGAREMLGRLVLLDREVIQPGEKAFVQIRLESPMAFKYGDRFVVRFYSPVETIGGGRILDPTALRHKRYKESVLEEMTALSEGRAEDRFLSTLQRLSATYPSLKEVAAQAGLSIEVIRELLEIPLVKAETVFLAQEESLVHSVFLEDRLELLIQGLSEFHLKNPLLEGIGKNEVKSRFFKECKGKIYDEILNLYTKQDMIKVTENVISLPSFQIVLNEHEQSVSDSLTRYYEEATYNPSMLSEVLAQLGVSTKEMLVVHLLESQGKIVKLADGYYMSAEAVSSARTALIQYLNEHNEITLGVYRDLLGTSRRGAVNLLEYFDQMKVTQRAGEGRRLK